MTANGKQGLPLTFTVTLSPASTQKVTARYATANGSAIAGRDYTAKSGLLTFSPGQTRLIIPVFSQNDSIPEADETFFVDLSGATGATVAKSRGIGTLIDN